MTRRLGQGCLGALFAIAAVPVLAYLYVRPELMQFKQLVVASQPCPPRVANALLAAEDPIFLARSRFDTTQSNAAVLSAMLRELLGGSAIAIDRHASLTDQMIGWQFQGMRLSRFAKAIFLGVFVDASFSKPDILNAYASHVYLGRVGEHPIYGIREAAKVYFGMSPEQLSVAQCASLAATVARPSAYQPSNTSQPAVLRRLRVVEEMRRLNMITANEYADAKRTLARGR